MALTKKLGMPEIASGQSQKEITHNEALRILDTLVHLSVKNATTASAPATGKADGDAWIIKGKGGAWSTYATNQIVQWLSGVGYINIAPVAGMLAHNRSTGRWLQYSSTNKWMPWRTQVRTAVNAATYTVQSSTDTYLGVVYTSAGAVNITLASGVDGAQITVKDEARKAGTNNITVSAKTGDAIDGAANLVINVSGASRTLLHIGGIWSVTGGYK